MLRRRHHFTFLYTFPRVKLQKAIIVYLMTDVQIKLSVPLGLSSFPFYMVSSLFLYFCFSGGHVLLWDGPVWAVVWPPTIVGSSPVADSKKTFQGYPACSGNPRGSAVLLPAGFDAGMLGDQTREGIKRLFEFESFNHSKNISKYRSA